MGSLVESYEKESWAEEYPPKVKAMFEAVLELFESGRGLSSLTVSEITAKAGIGKGTAYEYFSSKEEIIAGALNYEAKKHIKIISNLIEEERNFREILMTGFDIMDSVFEKQRGFALILRIVRDDTINGGNVLTEIEKHKCNFDMVKDMINRVAEIARKENLIRETDEYRVQSAIISQVAEYAIFVMHQRVYQDIDKQVAKETAYENILKMLN